jgi:hypothetical protein
LIEVTMRLTSLFIILILLLSACGPGNGINPQQGITLAGSEQSAYAYPISGDFPPPPPLNKQTMVVTMIASEPRRDQADQSPTPTAHLVTQMPKTLAELGIQATTFQDAYAGLALDIPSSWKITELPDELKKGSTLYSTSLRSADIPRGPKQQEGIPLGMAAVDVTVLLGDGSKTLDEAIRERRTSTLNDETPGRVTIQSEEDWVLQNGLKAHRFLFNRASTVPGTPDEMSSLLVTVINGHVVLVSGAGDQSLFNIVAASIRELK